MEHISLFEPDATKTRDTILQATYEVICEEGYSGVSIAQIATRAGISKSVIYYHFENKDAIVQALLRTVLDQLLCEFFENEAIGPRERMESFLEFVFDTSAESDCLATGPHCQAYIELRTQATHDDGFRKTIQNNETQLHDTIHSCLKAGIEDGRFRIENPQATTTVLVTLIQGTLFRRATTGDPDSAVLHEYAENLLNL